MNQTAPPVKVRRLEGDDAEAFSVLRREVTRDNPVPMGLTFEEELTRTLDGFRAQLSAPLPNAVFGCFVQGELAATAAVGRAGQFPSSHHKMVMWGVFTSPRYRRRGLGRQVVETALQHAFDNGAHRVNLQVYLPNEPAIALYKKMGFVKYGIESEAVCLDGQYHDGVHMTLAKDRHDKPLHPTAFGVC
ncbi:GNAT family N-acetyltransferase [Acidovorax sp.]|uniref:GNAT family N-acetyltransferase n=1 Tax=Acidovorax sp. TaxID=1872122 RepID=UPI0027B95A18|nr:GNAT family N-acetyltransferase [Acidovorax sp.]